MVEWSRSVDALPALENPRFLRTPHGLEPDIAGRVPDIWWDLVLAEERYAEILKHLWAPVAARLPETLAELTAMLQGAVVLVEQGNAPSLLYVFEDEAGEPVFYQGFLPLRHDTLPSRWRSVWGRLPAALHNLYTVHNGWYLIPSHSGGHLPVTAWSFLSDDEWRLERQLVERMPIDPDRTVVVYAHGGGGYLGFELSAVGENGPATPLQLWSHDLTNVHKHIDFWATFDGWTVAVLEDMALRNNDVPEPALDAAWELWYQDTFDRDCPRQVEAAGVGLVDGLLALWRHHLFETVQADGTRGFWRFNLWLQQARRSIHITGDWDGQIRLRAWALEDEALLRNVAVAHSRLVLAGETSASLVAAVLDAENRVEFALWLAQEGC
jgi:hypothetical protein